MRLISAFNSIWAVDLAKKAPNAQVDGFDIDISQTPPTKWLPQNVQIGKLDIFSDLPQELHAKYECVSPRFYILHEKSSLI